MIKISKGIEPATLIAKTQHKNEQRDRVIFEDDHYTTYFHPFHPDVSYYSSAIRVFVSINKSKYLSPPSFTTSKIPIIDQYQSCCHKILLIKWVFPKLLFSVEKVNIPRSLYCAHWESYIPNNNQTDSVKRSFIWRQQLYSQLNMSVTLLKVSKMQKFCTRWNHENLQKPNYISSDYFIMNSAKMQKFCTRWNHENLQKPNYISSDYFIRMQNFCILCNGYNRPKIDWIAKMQKFCTRENPGKSAKT